MSNTLDEIHSFISRYESLVFEKDVDGVVSLYSDDVSVFETWGAWAYDGITSWRQSIHQWLTSLGDEKVRVSLTQVSLRGTSDLASVSALGLYSAISPSGKTMRSMQNRITWALSKIDGSWKIIHEHTSVPVDFSTFKAILD